ncbi:MAG: hypothetical protein ABI461_21715 [Polyangiaceae bacterium]
MGWGALGGWVLAVMALNGCAGDATPHPFADAPPLSYTTNFVGTWTDAEKTVVEAAFAEWPTAIAYDLDVVRVTDVDPWANRCKSSRAGLPDGEVLEGYTYIGKTMCIYLDDITRDPHISLTRVAAHEYGHALGISFGSDLHYEGSEPSLMKPDADDDTVVPQAVDLVALRAHLDASRPQ